MKEESSKHPKELFVLAFAELCERFTFWGTGNLLVLYLIEHYKTSAESASHTYGLFVGFAAFLPLIGGYIADRWNYHQPLFIGALVNAIGCFLIALDQPFLLPIALALIAIGYGLFTPSLLSILGYTYRHKPHLREIGFSIYYSSANAGLFLALISLGFIAQKWGWNKAFLMAGLVQLVGFIPLLWYLKKHHVHYKDLHPRSQSEPLPTGEISSKTQKSRITAILVVIVFSIVFWMPYSQGFSSMSVFALDFMDKQLYQFELPAAWVLSSESFFLIILAPVLSWLYKYLQRINKDPSPSVKTALGLIFMAVCFAIMMFATRNLPHGATHAEISFLYPITGYFFMAVGEMLLAPIGLSLISRLAPKRYTGLLIGIWYVCVGISFYIGGLFAGLIEKIPSLYEFFSIFVFVALIPGIVLLFLSKKLTRMCI